MLVLKKSGGAVITQGPVLKAKDFASVLQAGQVIAEALAEAARILEAAQLAAAAQQEQGYRDGLEKGKAEMAEQLVAMLGQSNLYLAKIEPALVDVVVRALRRVVGEINVHDRVERVVREGLQLLSQNSVVRVKVSPGQEAWMKTRVDTLLAAYPRLQFLEVRADERLPQDGCVLETDLAVIDASVETQLRAIEKALIQAIQ